MPLLSTKGAASAQGFGLCSSTTPVVYVGGTSAYVDSLVSGVNVPITSLTGGVASSPSVGDLVIVNAVIGTAPSSSSTTYTVSGNNSGAYSISGPSTYAVGSLGGVVSATRGKIQALGSADTDITISSTGSYYVSATIFIQVWRNASISSLTSPNYSTNAGSGRIVGFNPLYGAKITSGVMVFGGTTDNSYTCTSSDLSNFLTTKTVSAYGGYDSNGGSGYKIYPTGVVSVASFGGASGPAPNDRAIGLCVEIRGR